MNLEDKYVPEVGSQEEVSVCQNKVCGLGGRCNNWRVVKSLWDWSQAILVLNQKSKAFGFEFLLSMLTKLVSHV